MSPITPALSAKHPCASRHASEVDISHERAVFARVPLYEGERLFTGCSYGSIEAALSECVFNEALYQMVVIDNENDRQFQSYSPRGSLPGL